MLTLRIFTDPAFSAKGTLLCPLLVPWGIEFEGKPKVPDPVYTRTGKAYFERVGPDQCQLLVCPVLWRDDSDNDRVYCFLQTYQNRQRPIIIFCETDSEEPFPLSGATVFRGSLRRSRRLPHEHALPAFISDPIAGYGARLHLAPPPWSPTPMVGFCGQLDNWADSPLSVQRVLGRVIYRQLLSRPKVDRWLRHVGLRITRSEGKRVRHQAIGLVSRSSLLRSNFIVRDHFIDGVLDLPEPERARQSTRAHLEFCANILQSDYVLCPRGGGNWSYRLYETLALGRVPVFIDTDSVLPYDDLVAWRDHCVWVDGDRMERLPALLREHHQSHSEMSFRTLQQRCRELWLSYLSMDGFFRNFHQHECWRQEKLREKC